MSKQTVPQKILADALSKVAKFNKDHVDLWKAAGMTSKQWGDHWNGRTHYMKPDTETNIAKAVAEIMKNFSRGI